MRALRAVFLAAILTSGSSAAILPGRLALGFFSQPSGGGASLVFNCTAFGGTGCNSSAIRTAASASFSGSQILLTQSSGHTAGGAWYLTQENIQSFTTDFSFQIPSAGGGVAFVVQNSNATTNPGGNYGTNATADANGDGYGSYASQPCNTTAAPICVSVGLVFDTSSMNAQAYVGAVSSAVGLFINGGTPVDNGGLSPPIDLHALGITVGTGDTIDAHVVYDGSRLTATLTDAVTSASTTLSWLVNIPAVVGANTAYVGFVGATPPSDTAVHALDSWDWYSGYNTKLSAPTFSPAPGSYTTSQSVTMSCPAGATCYYTTNGQPPTSASAQYTGAITVSSSEYIQAIATESNYTSSDVAGANYSIVSSGAPFVDFPSGFASNGGLMQMTAYASLSGSNIVLTDAAHVSETASTCYVAPVNVQSFTWSTTITQAGSANGMALVIKNQLPSSSDTTNGTTGQWINGGPYDFGDSQPYLGYSPTYSSIAVSLNLYSPASSTGLFENGAEPSTGTSTSPVTLGTSGHSYTVLLTYSGTTLTEQINDTTAATQYGPVNYTVNIPSVIGSNSGYLCITGSTGGQSATQEVTAMTFHN